MAYFPFIHMQVAQEGGRGWSSGMEQGDVPKPSLVATKLSPPHQLNWRQTLPHQNPQMWGLRCRGPSQQLPDPGGMSALNIQLTRSGRLLSASHRGRWIALGADTSEGTEVVGQDLPQQSNRAWLPGGPSPVSHQPCRVTRPSQRSPGVFQAFLPSLPRQGAQPGWTEWGQTAALEHGRAGSPESPPLPGDSG